MAFMDEAQKQEIVDRLKVQHPAMDLYSLDSADAHAFFVHRRATAAERRIYRQLQGDGKKLEAQDHLMVCVLYPEPATFKKLTDETPFVVEMLENAILAASGIYVDAVRKKL